MKHTKSIYIGLISIFLIACENAEQKVSETTAQTIQAATTANGTVGTVTYNPLKPVEATLSKLSTNLLPIFTANCIECHGETPLQVEGENKNRFSVTTASDTYTNIISNTLVSISNPATSLLLKKATNVIPHYGKEKIKLVSSEYSTIFKWIKEGANNN